MSGIISLVSPSQYCTCCWTSTDALIDIVADENEEQRDEKEEKRDENGEQRGRGFEREVSEEIDFSVDTADASEGVRITKKLTEEEIKKEVNKIKSKWNARTRVSIAKANLLRKK